MLPKGPKAVEGVEITITDEDRKALQRRQRKFARKQAIADERTLRESHRDDLTVTSKSIITPRQLNEINAKFWSQPGPHVHQTAEAVNMMHKHRARLARARGSRASAETRKARTADRDAQIREMSARGMTPAEIASDVLLQGNAIATHADHDRATRLVRRILRKPA